MSLCTTTHPLHIIPREPVPPSATTMRLIPASIAAATASSRSRACDSHGTHLDGPLQLTDSAAWPRSSPTFTLMVQQYRGGVEFPASTASRRDGSGVGFVGLWVCVGFVSFKSRITSHNPKDRIMRDNLDYVVGDHYTESTFSHVLLQGSSRPPDDITAQDDGCTRHGRVTIGESPHSWRPWCDRNRRFLRKLHKH